jgi:hydrogenase 3 maturation protease
MQGAVDCGTTPENHTATLRKNPPRVLLVVDAVDMGLSPGECRKFSLRELDSVIESSHSIPLSILLANFADSVAILALGIQPSTLRLGAPLSEPVEKAAHHLADLIAQGRWDEVQDFVRDRLTQGKLAAERAAIGRGQGNEG